MDIVINYWSVLAAGIAAFAVGALWYSPFLFGNKWRELMGFSEETMHSMKLSPVQSMSLGFITTLITAYVLAHLMALIGVETLSGALQLGAWVWFGFIAVTQAGSVLWENRPIKILLINASQTLVSTLVMAGVLVWLV